MPIQNLAHVWHNGKFIPWDQATLHVSSHAINYGSAVFDGFRCYARKGGSAAFRVREHLERLFESARVYEVPIAFSLAELSGAVQRLIQLNRVEETYLRPIALRGYGESGMVPTNYPVEVYLLGWRMGTYLGPQALREGVDICVSSWSRMAPNTIPALAKVAGNYLNSLLVRMEAIRNGYAEGVALNVDGTLSEGSGENVFLVRRGKLHTPPLSSSILGGITRDALLTLAADLGIPVVEESIPRELLYCSDEVFLCGSAAEVTPVRSVDRKLVSNGKPGPITCRLQSEFFSIVRGETPDRHGWLTIVEWLPENEEASASAAGR